MEDQQYEEDYSSVIETLTATFGEVLNKEAIISIVESYEGDLEMSADAIMEITTNENQTVEEDNKIQITNSNSSSTANNQNLNVRLLNPEATVYCPNSANSQVNIASKPTTMSYAKASGSGAIPRNTAAKKPTKSTELSQLDQILNYHSQGIRTLIMMRGPPGSGKSYSAKRIINAIYNTYARQYYNAHIFSTDDFFMQNGVYVHNKSKLSEVHSKNQKRARDYMSQGVSPVIIDNTNIEIWEMEPYIRDGVRNGYTIFLMEPKTPWGWKPYNLAKKNEHNVPLGTIKKMVENYERVTVETLVNKLKIGHYLQMKPLIRKIPPFEPPLINNPPFPLEPSTSKINVHNKDDYKKDDDINLQTKLQELVVDSEARTTGSVVGASDDLSSDDEKIPEVYEKAQVFLDQIARVARDWENGENWEEENQQETSGKSSKKINELVETSQGSKPQRQNKKSKVIPSENSLSSFNDVEDWSKLTMFMPSWNDLNPPCDEASSKKAVEKVSSSTCMEIGDTNMSNDTNPLKIVTATPRNINQFCVINNIDKIPEIRMLDKSTSTNETVTANVRCKNEEKHFIELKNLFKNVAKSDLRDIFDKCHGDVNWAVEIVLDGMSNDALHSRDSDDLSEDDEIGEENDNSNQCSCLSAYHVIPDQNTSTSQDDEMSEPTEIISSPEKRKIKKEMPAVSEASLQLKQQFEQNFVISDDHYSPHCLKLRKMRREGFETGGENSPEAETISTFVSESPDLPLNDTNRPSTSNANRLGEFSTLLESETDDDMNSNADEIEKTISIDLSKDLISQLHEHYGWNDMLEGQNISPVINVPVSILNELNALWIESVMYQLAENGRQLELILKQDEEFARELARKEEELLTIGKEPEMPDFKEIMDMDYALSLYQKDVEQWRSKEPKDLAAIMTRDKLNNLFPEVSPVILSEILMAHENNFEATVESLLVSTGQESVLEVENGVSQFIMKKEFEQREQVIQEEKRVLSEEEWPALPMKEELDMSTVNKYREEGDRHLKMRNISHQKAQDLVRRGMTPAAAYYSEVAAFHTLKYEQANSYAAAILMRMHAAKNPNSDTVDLHFLRVNEAKESLDIFLDGRIQDLKSVREYNPYPKHYKVFFITGRGLHSNGRPRIKPAVKKRLTERGLRFIENNPGLLSARISADDKLSYQLS